MTAYKKGFTLIELLIVMAILGVLAVVVLVAINPVQQLARTRDAGRKSGVGQVGRAMEAYYTAHGGSYIAESTTWLNDLMNAGELSTVPSGINPGVTGYTACADNILSNWCYDTNGASLSNAIVYTVLESQSESSKCAAGLPVFAWSTADGRGGLVCDADGNLDATGTQTWNPTQ
jgi:prepilin-type N-terminal cleavage/methylation domain-containing protein